MKSKKQYYKCLYCDWNESTHSHKYDGSKCPKCDSAIVPIYVPPSLQKAKPIEVRIGDSLFT